MQAIPIEFLFKSLIRIVDNREYYGFNYYGSRLHPPPDKK
jgi:hypothetical protein